MVNVEGHFDNSTWNFQRNRIEPLQRLVDALGNVLLSQGAPTMAKFEGAKVLHLLQTPRRPRTSAGRAHCPVQAEFAEALDYAVALAPSSRALASAIAALSGKLTWEHVESGPYASVNFMRDHAQVTLIGPGGIEERSDLIVGLTIMAPYSRFPDHQKSQPRVFIPLTSGQFLSATGEWLDAKIGVSAYHPAGRNFAMRCTRHPLLMVWLHRLSN